MGEWLIAVCDDEKIWRNKLMKDCIKVVENEERVLGFSNKSELLAAFENNLDIKLVFMDILLGEENGIEVKNELEEKGVCPYVAYITSYAGFMDKAFGYNVLHFLQKPAKLEEIKAIIEEVDVLIKEKHISKVTETLKVTDVENNSYIFKLNQIEMICVDDHYSTVCFHENGSSKSPIQKKIIVRESLNHLEKQLDKALFFRVNKSTIINLGAIERISRNSLVCCGETIKISRLVKTGFKNAIEDYKKHSVR